MPEPKQSERLLTIALVTGILADLALVVAMIVMVRWILFGNAGR
ncbi:MAG: hypothetical protein WC869_11115 [Phycisphaerae bacterium]|jgi:hypothetical protein